MGSYSKTDRIYNTLILPKFSLEGSQVRTVLDVIWKEVPG